MMHEIYKIMLERLKSCGIAEVYPAFDAVPVGKKSHALFAVLVPEEVTFGEGYPVKNGAVYPFTARLQVALLTPMQADMQDTMRFFFAKVIPAMLGADCTFGRFEAGLPKPDLRLQKMVCGGTFRLNGSYYHASETEGSV